MTRAITVRGCWAAVLLGVLALGSPWILADEENSSALKYHAALQKRPEPGYLFDRFYNAWLDQSTAESLQEFLQKQIERSDTTANRLLLAFFHSKQNNDQAAVDELSKALKADPHNAALWYHRAQAESRMLDFDSAIADLRRAAKSKPDDKQSLAIERLLGTLLARNRQTTEAIAVWKAILTAHPDDEDLCEDIIELHVEEGLYPQAAQLLESLISRTKDPYAAVTRRLRLGDVHQRAGRRQKAVELYSSALRESGENSWLEREILAQIEQSFRAEDDLVGLKKQYAKLIETYPKRIVLRQRQCRLLADLGQSEEAIRGYRDILERTPGDRANREEFVEMLCRAGRLETAVQELETLCQQNPKDAELRVRLAKLWNQAKNPQKAVEAARQYLDLSDHSEYAYLRAARLVESFGDRSRAAKFYQTMADAFRDSPSAQEAFAAFLYADGQKDRALTIWKSLAAKADLNQTLNIARTLDARNEDKTALEILTSREKQFGDDPLFLGQRVGTALRLKQYESCLPWARRRVELAKTSAELEAAVVSFLTACQQADRLDPTLRELKAIHPRPIALSCLLAELLETVGDSPQADQLLQAPAAQGEPLAVAEQIRLFTTRGQWAEAAAATRRLLELSGGRQSPLVRRLVELYERNGQFDEAMKWVETWKRLSPGATTPWLTEARLLQMQGKAPELALDSLRKAIQRFPDDEELRTRLAQTYQDLGKPRDAEQVYWQLYEKASDLSDKLRWVSELAQSAQREGTTPRLIELFRQRSQNNRQSIVPWMAMAEIYRVVDDSQNRRQALLAAAKLKPDDLQLLTQIARLEELEGDWKSAVATLERAAALDKTTQTRQKIATLHLSFGNRDTGLAMMRDLLGEQIADPRVVERLADSLCGMQEWERAVELLRPRLAEHPGDYRLRYLLGVAYEESGKTSEALDQFVTLLDRQEELPNLKKKLSSNAAANLGYLDLLGRLLPAEAVDWFRLSEGRHMAYGHRQPGMAQAMNRGGTGVVSTIFQPPSVDAVRSYAMAHVLTLATGLDDSQTAALTAALKSHGVRDPKVLLKLGVNLQGGMPNVTEALDENPNNEALLAMAVFTRFDPSGSNREDDMVRAFKKFRKSRPELAVMAAMQAESLLDDGLTLAATLQRPNPFVVMAIAQSLGGGPWGNQRRAFTLDPKHRNAIVRQLVAWYPQMSKDQNSPFGPWAFYLVANAVRAAGNAEAYFTLLDNEVTQWRKNPSQQALRQAVMVFGRSNTPLLAPLKFPPDQLSDFPPNVLTMLSRSQDNPFQPPSPDEETTDWTPKKIVPLLQKIQDPTLRVLLAQNDEASQLVESELKTMLAQKPPRLDAYLLAAGKASTDSRYGDAIGLLEKARHLPMKPEMRRQVDAAIVSAAMAVKDANDKNRQEWLKIGGDAALRLRRQRLDPAQREQLALALDDLGLKDEAKKLEKQLVAASSSPSFSPSPYAAPMTPTNQERLEKMVAAGNRQSAVRLLVNELRSLVMQVAANPGNRSWLRNQAREMKKRMNHLGLTDEVMQQFTPDQDASPARLNECATALVMFDRTSEARTLYERVLAKRPKDDNARVALLLMSARSDSRSADIEKHLSQLSDVGSNQLGQSLNEGVTDMESPLDERFRLVELAIRLLTVSKEHPQINAPWAMALVQSFGRRLYWNNQSNQQTLPSLYEREKTNDSSREVTVELLRRRRKLHDDLCLRMIDVPDLSRAGFRYLLAASEASDKPLSDDEAKQFRQYAEKILLDESQPKLRSPRFGVTAYYGNQGNPNEVRPREPEDFLVAQAWQSNDWRSIDEVLLPKLAGGRGATVRKKITRLMQLYRCPADEFLTLATQVAKEPATAMPGMMPNDSGLETVVDVWADRKLSTVDLEPMIFEAMRRNPTSPYQPMQTTFPSRYLATLADRGETKKAEAVVEHLTTVYLGPAEKRAEFVQKNFQRNQITPGTANAKIYTFGQILSQLAQDDSLVFLVFAQIESTPQLGEQYGFRYRPQQIVQQNLQKRPDRVVAMLEASPWTADVDRFRVLSTGQNADTWPLVQVLRNLGNQQTSPVWTALAEKQKSRPTFGRGLLLALRDQQNNPAALLQYLDQTIDAIQKLPSARQTDLAVLLKPLLSDSLRDESTAQTPAEQWLRRQTADRSSRALEKLRSAKRFEELGIANCDPWQVSQYLAGVLPEVIDEDPKAARIIFFRVVEMAEDAQRRTGANYYAGNDETFADSALNFVFQ
ncbi:MAG: tetratricopeptide repeat protein, partial [Thermoguttaceae bacterium]